MDYRFLRDLIPHLKQLQEEVQQVWWFHIMEHLTKLKKQFQIVKAQQERVLFLVDGQVQLLK